jgi:Zn-dependent protease
MVSIRTFKETLRNICYIDNTLGYCRETIFLYFPLTLIVILNVWILIVAEKQRKRIWAETANNRRDANRFFHALKAVKTFSIVVAVLTFCVLTPTVVGTMLPNISSCSESCQRLWFAVFNYEFYGINSIVNAFIYGMRHIEYRKAPGQILHSILRCKKHTNKINKSGRN